MSILNKEWVLKYQRKPEESLWEALLAARKIQDTGKFFATARPGDLHDPFLFPEMGKAVERIQNAINAREKITIYSDYDVDGISGAAILIHALRFLGAEVSSKIPHRIKEGYGLQTAHISELKADGTSVIITVDLGISCRSEIALAQEQGIDVIITDHHSIPDKLPNALATLHPKLAPDYPFKHLSGSGVAFKLASALLIKSGNEDMITLFTDLASLGTVADCVPLTGENRQLVKLGLEQMKRTQWDGLRAILECSGAWRQEDFNSFTIGFQIGPRLNAAGRIDSPQLAMQTLLARGPEARDKSRELEELNTTRRDLTQTIQEEVEAALDLSAPILIAAGKGWSSGIVGLIAGRVQEKYSKPTFIIEDRGETMVGSARSLSGFHAVEAIKQAAHLMENFGGHEQAAGFHMKKENYPAFKEILLTYAEKFFAKNPLVYALKIDLALRPEELTTEELERITSFAPFGIANEEPLFLLENIKILDARTVGKEEKHLKFQARFGDQTLDGIAFHFADRLADLKKAKSLVATLERNDWNGNSTLQIKLADFA